MYCISSFAVLEKSGLIHSSLNDFADVAFKSAFKNVSILVVSNLQFIVKTFECSRLARIIVISLFALANKNKNLLAAFFHFL